MSTQAHASSYRGNATTLITRPTNPLPNVRPPGSTARPASSPFTVTRRGKPQHACLYDTNLPGRPGESDRCPFLQTVPYSPTDEPSAACRPADLAQGQGMRSWVHMGPRTDGQWRVSSPRGHSLADARRGLSGAKCPPPHRPRCPETLGAGRCALAYGRRTVQRRGHAVEGDASAVARVEFGNTSDKCKRRPAEMLVRMDEGKRWTAAPGPPRVGGRPRSE